MKKFIYLIIFCCLVLLTVTEKSEASPTVTYIASEGFYINGGTNYGLQKNDTLQVMRNDSLIAICVIGNISRNSSACTIVTQNGELKVGDMLFTNLGTELMLTEETEKVSTQTTQEKKKISETPNKVSGYISTQQYFITDMSSSSLSSSQHSVRTRLKVENLFGQNLKLQVKHRSKYYNRSDSKYYSSIQEDWSYRLYEFAIYSTDESQAMQYSFGRQSVYQMRGVGFIDGFYVSRAINDKITVGTAIGLEPDNLDQSISFSRKKTGLFLAYTFLHTNEKRFTLTTALAGSYIEQDVNREYLYLQADYSSPKLSVNQFAEVDYFRSARKEAFHKSLSLTSYYGRLNYAFSQKYSIYFSYDTRERVLYYDDIYRADSLFEETNNNGVKFGVRLRPLEKLSISINTGLHTRTGSFDDNKYASIAISTFRFPQEKSSLTMRFAYLSTMFTTAYRPSLSYRFPIKRGVYLTLSGTSNMYSSSSGTNSTTYFDAQTYFTLSNNYFISSSIRQYFGKDLQSNQLYFELGKYL